MKELTSTYLRIPGARKGAYFCVLPEDCGVESFDLTQHTSRQFCTASVVVGGEKTVIHIGACLLEGRDGQSMNHVTNVVIRQEAPCKDASAGPTRRFYTNAIALFKRNPDDQSLRWLLSHEYKLLIAEAMNAIAGLRPFGPSRPRDAASKAVARTPTP